MSDFTLFIFYTTGKQEINTEKIKKEKKKIHFPYPESGQKKFPERNKNKIK